MTTTTPVSDPTTPGNSSESDVTVPFLLSYVMLKVERPAATPDEARGVLLSEGRLYLKDATTLLALLAEVGLSVKVSSKRKSRAVFDVLTTIPATKVPQEKLDLFKMAAPVDEADETPATAG
jgi:hypothetical protein